MILKYLISRRTKAILFGFWDCFFPKNSSKIILVIKDRTEFSGNLRVVSDILLEEKIHQVFVYKDGKMVPEIKQTLEQKGASVLEGWGLNSLYHLLTSGIFIFSHAPRDAHITKRCKNRTIINLWHGVAFKTIENLMPNIPAQKQKQLKTNAELYDLVIASSKLDQETNAKAFIVDMEKIKITGLPRYELLKNEYPLDSFLTLQKEKLLNDKKDKKLILYAPTFREKNISAIDQINSNEWQKISDILKRFNAILAIRPHSYDTAIPSCLVHDSNFCWLPHTEFTETNLILQHVDLLIVDFSSIWIDFLLLDRPIIGFAKDFEHYMHNERGFIYDFDRTFPSKFSQTVDDLCSELKYYLENNILQEQYIKPKTMFHHYDLSASYTQNLEKTMNALITNS